MASLNNEIKLTRMVEGERFVKLEAVYETENSVYLITELMEGGEIFSNNPQYSLTSEEKKHLTRQSWLN